MAIYTDKSVSLSSGLSGMFKVKVLIGAIFLTKILFFSLLSDKKLL